MGEALRFQAQPAPERGTGFLAEDAETRVFCNAHAGVRKQKQNDEILAIGITGNSVQAGCRKSLIFDSKLTTYDKLNRLNPAWGCAL